jgi:predicted secreted protein
MGFVSGLAIYFIIWWISLFLILPFGVRTQAEDESRHLGTMPSAPVHSRMRWRVLATTILASLIFGGFYWAVEVRGLGLDDLTFLPMPDSLK